MLKNLKITTLLAALVATLLIGCNGEYKESSDVQLQKQTESKMKEANRQAGFPAITNFQEKKIMRHIYELRDQESLICYAYLVNERTGRVGQFLGKSIGYGLPYSTQYSNPEKIVTYGGGSEGGYYRGPMPQPEPNGLFMPEGLSATWLLLVDPKTNIPRPVYIEPSIIVSPFPLHETGK